MIEFLNRRHKNYHYRRYRVLLVFGGYNSFAFDDDGNLLC